MHADCTARVHQRFTCENGPVNAESLPRALEGIVGSDFSDPTNERIIYLSALGLAIIGLALLAGTILWWRRGRQEHPALSPLEVMSRRSWYKAPEGDRRRRLDHVRLDGSAAGQVEAARADPLDLQALVRSVPQAFDDLREPGADPVVAEAGTTFAVDGEGEASIVDEAPEPAEVDKVEEAANANDAVKVEAAAPDAVAPDATAVAIERPAPPTESPVETPEPPVETPKAPVEVLATGPNDSLE
ncbi:MAG: hypothetical protein QOH53_48 [Ilumatobacteraceae bacterium]